jgi:hypothetical protein
LAVLPFELLAARLSEIINIYYPFCRYSIRKFCKHAFHSLSKSSAAAKSDQGDELAFSSSDGGSCQRGRLQEPSGDELFKECSELCVWSGNIIQPTCL